MHYSNGHITAEVIFKQRVAAVLKSKKHLNFNVAFFPVTKLVKTHSKRIFLRWNLLGLCFF